MKYLTVFISIWFVSFPEKWTLLKLSLGISIFLIEYYFWCL